MIELTVRDTIRLHRALSTNEANFHQTFGADGQTFDEEKDASGIADGQKFDEEKDASSFADGRINDEGPFRSSQN